MLPSPGKSDPDVHDARDEEYVDVHIDPMSNNWSEAGLRANPRQDNSVTQRTRRRRNEEEREDGKYRPAWAGHVNINVVVRESSSLISARESHSVDQASQSGSSQAGHPSSGQQCLSHPVSAVAWNVHSKYWYSAMLWVEVVAWLWFRVAERRPEVTIQTAQRLLLEAKKAAREWRTGSLMPKLPFLVDGCAREQASWVMASWMTSPRRFFEGGLRFLGAEEEAVGHRAGMVADLAPADAKTEEGEGSGWGLEADELGHESLAFLGVCGGTSLGD